MGSLLFRSNSTQTSSRPSARLKTPGSTSVSSSTPGKPIRSSTPGSTPVYTASVASSPTTSIRPPRPKSTLGFSSKFGLAWKNSLRSSASIRSGLPPRAEESPSAAPSRAAVPSGKVAGERAVGGGEARRGGEGMGGGLQRLRRKVSSEWWAAPAGARPSTPGPSTPATPAPLGRSASTRERTPRPSSWANMSPFIPLSASSTATSTPIRPRTPPRPTLPLPLPPSPKPDLETPRTKAVHAEWRAAARELEGDLKVCLLGAVCLSITDPLEGVKDEHLAAFAPRFRPAIKLVSPRPAADRALSTTPTLASPKPTLRGRQAVGAMSNTTPTPKPKPRAFIPPGAKTKSPIPPSPSPTPKPRARPPTTTSPTPLTRRPLVSRRTVERPTPTPSVVDGPRTVQAGPPKALRKVGELGSGGVTPRSARRMRTSLKMTPLIPSSTPSRLPLPVAYVPLKAPADSPRHRSAPPSASPEPIPARPPSRLPPSARGDPAPLRRLSASTSSAGEGTVTPPNPPGDGEEIMSPWQVVCPSPAFARRHEGQAVDADWVMPTPVRRSLR